jgi:hypothetical protein
MGENTESWAKLRQVVVATTSLEDDVAALRAAFGLGHGFTDPELKAISLEDATLPISAERYLEFVSPNEPGTAVANWLAKVGGRGGFVLSVQVPDTAGIKARALARGVRIPVDTEALGRPVLQLHPKDLGVVLEVDEIADRAEWFWDDIDPGPEPGARVSEIVGVEVPVADPVSMTALWTELLDLPVPTNVHEIDLGGTWVRFTPGGPSANWTVVLRRAEEGAAAVAPELAGITFQLV